MEKFAIRYKNFRCVRNYALAILAFFVFQALAYAGIVVTPERHILELKQQEEKTVAFDVTNSGNEDMHMSIDVKEWSKATENKDINIDSWLAIPEKEFDIKAGETKALNIKVNAPSTATGEMVAMIFLCYKEQKDSPINIRYGNPLYLIIKGTEKYDAMINKIDCNYSVDGEIDHLNILVSIANAGNVHIKPDIAAGIFDKDNNLMQQLKIEEGDVLFPGKSNVYKLEWHDTQLQEGSYKAKVACGYKDKFKLPMQDAAFEVKKEKSE